MPTENELKFVIDKRCEKRIKKTSKESYDINQGYLIATRGITVRIRKSIEKHNKKCKNYFTLKVNTNGRTVEIEQEIDERDFKDLWNIALNKLQKIRYVLKNKKERWELDFFKDHKNQTYMAIAEIEMPEEQQHPNTIPDIVKENLIYQVPLIDIRFSNKLLSDARYAKELIKEVKKKEKK
ncbi:MAG: hypothetical protein EKK64_03305 [Neisseriaceae bacterium]|nr:MAG: hypothetical protein EKK64_03305 [Neisseriaceae bacterium]